MKRLELLLFCAFVGIGLATIGCGTSGSPDSGAQPAASAPAPADAPATAPASEPTEAGASDQAAEGDATQEAAPQEKRRFVPPVRGVANIEVTKPVTKVVSGVVVTTMKVRNASNGAIALLTVNETWYDKGGNPLGGDSFKDRKPFLPGEVIDVELRTPRDSKFNANQLQFSHANGKIEVKTVAKFPEPPQTDQ